MFTVEQMRPYMEKYKKEREESEKKYQEMRRKELEAKGVTMIESNPEDKDKNFHGDCDHPNTMENGQATALYIVIMLVGLIFNARWLIWIVASVVYFRFITRHSRK